MSMPDSLFHQMLALPTPTNSVSAGNFSLTPLNIKTGNNNANHSGNGGNNSNQTFYSYMPIANSQSTLSDALSLSNANTPSHASAGSSPFASFNLASGLTTQNNAINAFNNANNGNNNNHSGGGNSVLQSPTPMLGAMMNDLSNFSVRMPAAFPAVNAGSNSALASLFPMSSNQSLMGMAANSNFANQLSSLTNAANNSGANGNERPMPMIAAPIPHHPHNHNHSHSHNDHIHHNPLAAHPAFATMGSDGATLSSLGLALSNNLPRGSNNSNSAINTIINNSANNANTSSGSKGDNKRKAMTAESTASLRRKKHKEVEIRRRKKINTLFSDLSSELECGPTDKASILLYALNFIKAIKKKHGNSLDLKALSGSNTVAIVADNIKTETEEEMAAMIDNGVHDHSDDSDSDDPVDRGSVNKKARAESLPSSSPMPMPVPLPAPLTIAPNTGTIVNLPPTSHSDSNSVITSPTIHRPTVADAAAILSIPPSPAGQFSTLSHAHSLNALLSQSNPAMSAFYNPNTSNSSSNPQTPLPLSMPMSVLAPIIPTPIVPQLQPSTNPNTSILNTLANALGSTSTAAATTAGTQPESQSQPLSAATP